jgi:multiple antibiotic resistance protein
MHSTRLIFEFLSLTFSALLPVVNPIGSALVFLGLVGGAPEQVIRRMAKKIALSMALFLFAIDAGGAAILKFFAISLPVVQFAGGFVLAAMGWNLLNQKEEPQQDKSSPALTHPGSMEDGVFYPFTFPVTTGPGCIVVMLTLSAHASKGDLLDEVFAHLGIMVGVILISTAVLLSYTYAQRITLKISRQTVHGILRVIAFILLCIGVQIAWNGLKTLIQGVGKL